MTQSMPVSLPHHDTVIIITDSSYTMTLSLVDQRCSAASALIIQDFKLYTHGSNIVRKLVFPRSSETKRTFLFLIRASLIMIIIFPSY